MYDVMVRQHIEKIFPYIPGKPVEEMAREWGTNETVQLASNENPFGPSPKAVEAIINELGKINRYPESHFYYLIEKLSSVLKIPRDQIIAGNGSNEIIDLLVRTLVAPGEEVITAEHAFGMFKQVTQVNDGKLIEVPQTKEFVFDLVEMAGQVNEKTKIIFIANPNNPTGTYANRDAMDKMFKKLKGKRVLVVLDEAYLEFVDAEDYPHAVDYFNTYDNVFVMRTFSKAYGLAGLRVGYGFGNKELVSMMYKIKQTFNVNRLAQVAATAALDDTKFIEETRKATIVGRKYFEKEFSEMGIHYLPSQANFVMIQVGTKAGEIYEGLLKQGIVVRPMNMYQLPDWFRISVGIEDENRRVIKALKELL